MRRAVPHFLALASASAAVLAAALAHAQPAARQGLRPAFEDTDQYPRLESPRRPARRDTRPVGANAGNSDAQPGSYASPPGSGAGTTGFVSTNAKRRPPARRRGLAPEAAQTQGPAPLSLTPPGISATTGLPVTSGTSSPTTPGTMSSTVSSTASKTGSQPPAAKQASAPPVPAAPAPPRNPLLRIPDGTATGDPTGTINTAHMAQQQVTLLRRRVTPEEDAYAALGLRTGAFLVLPAVETIGGYDTNPARTLNGRGSSFITVAPELLARSDWTRHEVTATLRGSYTAYGATPELDRPAFDGKVTGRLDVSRNTALIGEGTFIVGTDNPGSPNVQAGLSRFPIYTTLGGSLGFIQRFNRVEVAVKGTAERTEYQDSVFTDGTTQSNADRDFNRYAILMRTSYDLMPGIKPFVETGADTRRYDLQVDAGGLQRDSNGWNVRAGSTFAFYRMLTGEIAVGYLQRNYVDPTLQPIQGPTLDAALIYAFSALTNVKLTASTLVSETTVAGTSGVFTHNAGIEVEHAFRRWLIGSLKFNFGVDNYVGSPRVDDRYAVSGTLIYKLNRMMQLKAELREEWLRSTVPSADYTATVMLLGMRLQR
ncbi:MAG: outer membrane beta-barrel protein [Alphaproteobacteria bacterium]